MAVRWLGVTLAILGAIFFGVPVLLWLAAAMPWQVGSAIAALGCIGFVVSLWPRERRDGVVVMPRRRYEYDPREEMERVP